MTRQAGEIEITPAMEMAGAEILRARDPVYDPATETAREVFEAMLAAGHYRLSALARSDQSPS